MGEKKLVIHPQKYTSESKVISMRNPENQFADELVWITIPIEEKLDLSSLYRFTNLKRLDVDYVISAKDIKGLHLESISAYFDDPAEAAEILDNPADIRELGFNAEADSLDGIELFENLETLYIDYSEFDFDAITENSTLEIYFVGYEYWAGESSDDRRELYEKIKTASDSPFSLDWGMTLEKSW